MKWKQKRVTAKQWRFFDGLLKGRSVAEMMTELRIAAHTMMRWCKAACFRETWAEVDAYLAGRARTEAVRERVVVSVREVEGIGCTAGLLVAAASGTAAAPSAGAGSAGSPQAAAAPGVDGAAGDLVALERERMRVLHGERAGQAYELMVERKAQREAARQGQ